MARGKLDGKVALVTGAGRGIGRAIAMKLASEGARLVINDLDDAPMNEAADAIRAAHGADVATVGGSVTADGVAERVVGAAVDRFGALDVIVNNAGFTWDSVIQKMTDEQFQAVMDVHVTAPFRILRAAAEPIRRFAKQEAEQGREVFRKVVNISSVSGLGDFGFVTGFDRRHPRAGALSGEQGGNYRGNHGDDEDDLRRGHAGTFGVVTMRHAASASTARSAGLLSSSFMSVLRQSVSAGVTALIASASALVVGSASSSWAVACGAWSAVHSAMASTGLRALITARAGS